MIRRLTIRRFKRFRDETFEFPGHVVFAGPNNCGKTTVLQAIAAWGLALNRWKELNDFQRHGGGYTRAPIARQAFHAVPLRAFDLLWIDREHGRGAIEIEIESTKGWKVAIELLADSSEQVYVRPGKAAEPAVVREAELRTVYVPAMTGLGVAEPVYQRPKLDQLLGQGKPGDVLRNLLVEAVEPRELCVLLGRPRILADVQERARLSQSLGILSHTDILQALDAPGVLYIEDYTDIAILREFARVLGHPIHDRLAARLFWKKVVASPRAGATGIQSKDHYEALQLVRD